MINVHRSSCKVMKLKLSWQIIEKYSSIKCHENSSSGSRVVPGRQTDRQSWRR